MPTQQNIDRRQFQFDITYFKDSGKFYTSEKFWYDCKVIFREGCPPLPYMNDVVDFIKTIRDQSPDAKWKSLPGLCTANWDGYILINCEDGFPCLILPNKEK